MPFKKGHKPHNKHKTGYANRGTFKAGLTPWNKGRKTAVPRCQDCGGFVGGDKPHVCRSVEAKGHRHCDDCGNPLRNIGWERYSKVCGRCGKKKWRKLERQLKRAAVELFGGECETCGYDTYVECLEFHHTDPEKKKKGKHFIREVLAQPEQFKLYCNRCHREYHIEHNIKETPID